MDWPKFKQNFKTTYIFALILILIVLEFSMVGNAILDASPSCGYCFSLNPQGGPSGSCSKQEAIFQNFKCALGWTIVLGIIILPIFAILSLLLASTKKDKLSLKLVIGNIIAFVCFIFVPDFFWTPIFGSLLLFLSAILTLIFILSIISQFKKKEINTKYTRILLIISLIAILLSGFMISIGLRDKFSISQFQSKFGCSWIISESTRNNCFIKKATETKNELICKKLNNYLNSQPRDACYKGVAISKKDESICANIDVNNQPASEAWLRECYYEVAIAKNDEMVCLEIYEFSSTRNKCIQNIAISKRNETICELLKYTFDIEDCKSNVK